jgi:hypothetical protein
MSLNISSDVVKLCARITIRVVLAKMGPRQVASFKRMVKTGVIKGRAVPARMATVVRKQNRAPYVRFGGYGNISWDNVSGDEDDLFQRLTAALVADQLHTAGARRYRKVDDDEDQRLIDSRPPEGSMYLSNTGSAEKILGKTVFARNPEISVPDVMDIDVAEYGRHL